MGGGHSAHLNSIMARSILISPYKRTARVALKSPARRYLPFFAGVNNENPNIALTKPLTSWLTLP